MIRGGLSIVGLLVTAQLARAEPGATRVRAHDVDPVYFVENADDLRLSWDTSVVLDLDVSSEISVHDLKTKRDVLLLANTIHRIPAGDVALKQASLRVPPSKIPEEQRRMLEEMGRQGRTLIVERVVATASLAGGDPKRPFTIHTRRHYAMEGERLRPLTQKEWDAIVDPVEIQLSPDGRSYRYQRGDAEIDPALGPFSPALKAVGRDRPVPNEGPVRDPLMEGKKRARD